MGNLSMRESGMRVFNPGHLLNGSGTGKSYVSLDQN